MKIKKGLYLAIISLLIAMNISTVLYYRNSISDMRKQSSFKAISSLLTFKTCLDNHHIENRKVGSRHAVREIDLNKAISNCS